MIVTASTVEDSGDLLSPTEIEDIVDTNSTGATSTKKKKKKKKKNRNTNDNDKKEVEVETAIVVEEEEEEETVAIVEEEEEEEEKTVNVAVEVEEQQQEQQQQQEEEETVANVVEEEEEEEKTVNVAVEEEVQQQEETSAVVVRKEAQKPMSPAVSLLEHGASVAGEEMDGSSVETVTENKKEVVAQVKKTSSHTVVSSVMDSRKAWGGQVKVKTDGPRIDSVIPYETLKSMRDGIDMTRKEEYLAADEFQTHFKQDIESFKKLPLWRQILLKKKVGLF